MAHNPETPDQQPKPDVQVGHQSSTIRVYNLPRFTDGSSSELLRVYTSGNLPGEMQQASLVTQVGQTEEGGTTLTMNFMVQLDNMTKDSDVLAKLQNHMLAQDQNYYKVGTAYYSNVLNIRTSRGLRLLAQFDHAARQLLISNAVYLKVDGAKPVGVTPTPLDYMDAGLQLLEMGRVMADVLTYEPRDPDAYRGWPESSKGCLIEIGRDLRPLPSPSDRANLGKRAVDEAKKPMPVPRPEVVNPSNKSVPEVTLDDIGGYENIKTTFEEIALIFKHPEIAAKYGTRPPRGVLLYGEGGTGKSMFIHALAHEMSAALRRVSNDQIYGKYVGDSEANIRRIFHELREAKVLTLALFDEFDASVNIVDHANSGADQIHNSVASIFREEMDTLPAHVLIGATTNRYDKIDPTLVRDGRFDYKIHVPMPNQATRLAIFGKIASKYALTGVPDFTPEAVAGGAASEAELFDAAIDWNVLARSTDGMSGAAINGIFLRLTRQKMLEEMRTGQATPITQADFTRTISTMLTDGA